MTSRREPGRVSRSVPGLLLAAAVLCLWSCAPLFDALPVDPDAVLVLPVSGTGSFTYEVRVDAEPRDVYFIFASSAAKDNYAVPSAQFLSVDGTELPIPAAPKLPSEFGDGGGRVQRIADFNRNPWAALGVERPAADANIYPRVSEIAPEPPRAAYSVGDTTTLRDDVSTWPSTCRYVSAAIPVGVDGTPRRLVVWVENASWQAGGTKAYLVTQVMVDWLAGNFLKSGTDNDVFDWLTVILGTEWANTPYSNLIGFDGDIHIVLADIEGDNSPNGGMVGYFWSLNNFKNAYLPPPYSGWSNERVMFVLDSVMFANPLGGGNDSVWSSDDYWAGELYSTLAHEFQHMISFYQRSILRGSEGADVWIEELCSLLAEDLLSERMGVPGPRGVDPADGTAGPSDNPEGRMPLFNRYTYYPLVVTGVYDVFDYSTTYAFGAWLARNYGSAALLRRLVHSPGSDESLVESAAASGGAAPSDFDSLLARWAASVLLSDREDLPPGYRYNTGGWFDSTLDGINYRLGSLDAFRYRRYGTAEQGPFVFTASGPAGQGLASSNVFFRAVQGFTGERSFEIVLPEGVRMYAVLK